MGTTLVIGESLVDIVTSPSGEVTEHVGGSPFNVACGLAALEHPVVLATQIGQDRRGEIITRRCEELGVVLDVGSIGDTPTSTARADLVDGQASYRFDLTWDRTWFERGCCGHVHVGSLGATMQPGATAVVDLVERARGHATVSYDPNCRPDLMGSPQDVLPTVEQLVSCSDVVKASVEDLAWLYPRYGWREVLEEWAAVGPALVMVTLGAQGAFGMRTRDRQLFTVQPFARHVVDTVGAGDSFMAGLLGGLLDGLLLSGPCARERLEKVPPHELQSGTWQAGACAGITCQRAGAHPVTNVELDDEYGPA